MMAYVFAIGMSMPNSTAAAMEPVPRQDGVGGLSRPVSEGLARERGPDRLDPGRG